MPNKSLQTSEDCMITIFFDVLKNIIFSDHNFSLRARSQSIKCHSFILKTFTFTKKTFSLTSPCIRSVKLTNTIDDSFDSSKLCLSNYVKI